MKFIKLKANEKRFIGVDIGETFIYDNKLYIRTPYIKSANPYSNHEYNALNLNKDCFAWLSDEALVEPVDVDIIVKGA